MEPTHSRMKADRAARVDTPSEHDTHRASAVIEHLVSPGPSNQDIATQLFIRPSTVEYHLHMVFRRLGVTRGPLLARRVIDTASAAPLVPLAPSASGEHAMSTRPP